MGVQHARTEAGADVSNIEQGWFAKPWKSAISVIPQQHRGKTVGVRTFTNKEFGGDVRVFYPTEDPIGDAKAAGWFSPSLSTMVDGYAHFMAGWKESLRKGTWMFEVISSILRFVVACGSLKTAKLPCTYQELKPASKKAPLIIWSHGLSGTGEEHGLFAARLATEGYVVALMHHTDGSSSKVTTADGRTIYFQHPDWNNYDEAYRQKGAEHRAKEVENVRQMLLSGEAGEDLQAACDETRVAVGGFSFGGATAALVAATMPEHYKCAVLWDGWFHIVLDSIQLYRDLPQQAFERGFSIPVCFIGSGQFAAMDKLADATKRIQATCRAGMEAHVPEHSVHMSFCDMVWWLPSPLLAKFGFSDKTTPYQTYLEILGLTTDFLKLHIPA